MKNQSIPFVVNVVGACSIVCTLVGCQSMMPVIEKFERQPQVEVQAGPLQSSKAANVAGLQKQATLANANSTSSPATAGSAYAGSASTGSASAVSASITSTQAAVIPTGSATHTNALPPAAAQKPNQGAVQPATGTLPPTNQTPGQPTVIPTGFHSLGSSRPGMIIPKCQSGCCGTADCGNTDCGNACGSACGTGNCGSVPCGPSVLPMMAMPPRPYGIDPNEFLCNGGDRPQQAFVRRDDSIGNLNRSDVVAHYTTESGDIEIAASNPVCLYAPRFGSVRKITGAVAGEKVIGLSVAKHRDLPVGVEMQDRGVALEKTTELAHADATIPIDALRERNRGVPVERVQSLNQQIEFLPAIAGIHLTQVQSLAEDQIALLREHATAAVKWTLDESVEAAIGDLKAPELTSDRIAEGFTVYDFPDAGRLEVLKLADRSDALPGQTVNFSITVRNVGDSPVSDVRIADNLTTRLEYVADSQECSAQAKFEAIQNEFASRKLVWTISDTLDVGESATITFSAKVR